MSKMKLDKHDCSYMSACETTPIKMENSNNPANTIKDEQYFSPFMRQMFVSLGGILLCLSAGLTTGFSATALPQINNSIPLTNVEKSWIASMVALPMPVGGILSGFLMDKYGRNNGQMVCCFPWIIGWLCIYFSYDFTLLYVGRFLTGFSLGLANPILTVYIAEISHPHHRGLLLSFLTLGISVGILFCHILGTYLNWRTVSFICSCVPFCSFVLFCFYPETPVWLIKNGLENKARYSFYFLQTQTETSKNEISTLLKKQTENHKKTIHKYGFFQCFTTPIFLKPLFTMCVFFIVQQYSGLNVIIFYTVNIIRDISKHVDEFLFTIVIGILRVLSSVVSSVLVNRYNRRPLFLASAISSVICIVSCAFCLQFFHHDAVGSIIALVFVMLYVIVSGLGLVPLPWIMTGEVFPIEVREFGNGVTNCFAFTMIFSSVKSAPFMFDTLGIYHTFYIFGTIAFIGTIILYFLLPETNNKSLDEVEENLKKNCN